MSLLCWFVNSLAWYGFLTFLFFSVITSIFLYWYWKIRKFTGDITKYFEFNDTKGKEFKEKWNGKKVPIYYLHEAYIAGEVDLKGDLLEALEDRRSFTTFTITPENLKFVFTNLIPEFFVHSLSQDRAQIADHYNRGNDFFSWFLGPLMVYTSGIFESETDSLEKAQENKFEQVLQKLHVKEGERLLDIGCGWGAFIRHATKKYKLKCIGVSLSSSQQEWHNKKCEEEGISKEDCNFQCKDYREIPTSQRFNKISCLEMSEHVGVLKYRAFAKQVYDLLEDDGLFYLQIAGLRMATQIEDYC
jgi:uncharacterized protein